MSREALKKQRMEDGRRGHPNVDLRDYADARGLDHRGQSAQAGFLAAFGMSEDLQFNVLRGTLPGGEHGVVFHDAKMIEGGNTFGSTYGKQLSGTRPAKLGLRLRDLVPFGDAFDTAGFWKVPYTTAAVRVPEAAGVLLGLNAGRPAERGALRTGIWREVAGVRLPGWAFGTRDRADEAAVREAVEGPLTELLTKTQPLGFEVLFRFGTLVVSQQHYAREAEELDALCEKASWLAGELRAIATRHARPLGFDVRLPEPFWLERVRALPAGDSVLGGDAQNLGSVRALADETGMEPEDAFAFMRGFGRLGAPGEAFGVLRGTLPGTDVHGRLVGGIERPAWDTFKAIDKALTRKIAGPFGCDTVLVPLDPGVPDTPGAAGERWIEGGRALVRDGVLVAWRARAQASMTLDAAEPLAVEAVRVVRDRGWSVRSSA